jgi:DNA-binding MarR family transcriptional regulator
MSNETAMVKTTAKATEKRRKQAEDTDWQLYEKINETPSSSEYELAKAMGWTPGKVNGAVNRLERDGFIKISREVRSGRAVKIVTPLEWWELLPPEEVDEIKKMEI